MGSLNHFLFVAQLRRSSRRKPGAGVRWMYRVLLDSNVIPASSPRLPPGATPYPQKVSHALSLAPWQRIGLVTILMLLTFTLGACTGEHYDLPVTNISIQGQSFDMEIASTPATREHGLMQRDSMPTYHGMIFVFESPGIYPFWMHYTRFPLDIIWLSDQGQIVTIATMQAYVETTEQNTVPALYVIELHAGMAQKLGLRTGMSIKLPSEVRNVAPATATTAAPNP